MSAGYRMLINVLAIAAVALATLGVLYLTQSHPRRALLAFVLAAGCGGGLWFATMRAARRR